VKNVECRTQLELDTALKDPNVSPILVGNGTFTAYDSSQVRAYGSSQVTAYDSSQVRAYGSSQVTASKHVAVTKHGKGTRVSGGVQIDYLPPQTLAEWLEEYGVQVKDGIAIVYKAVDSDFKSPHGGDYSPGTLTECDHWNTTVECGGASSSSQFNRTLAQRRLPNKGQSAASRRARMLRSGYKRKTDSRIVRSGLIARSQNERTVAR
jgi:hypothetical protein